MAIVLKAQLVSKCSTMLGLQSSKYFGCQLSVALKQTRCISRTAHVCRPTPERLYSDKHEWITFDGKVGKVGISQYAQEALGDIVYAQLPDVNATVEQYGECGALESVKAASELYSPVSGTVLEKNLKAEETPGIINKSCYTEGWLFKVQVKNTDELKVLMDEKGYQSYLKAQATDH